MRTNQANKTESKNKALRESDPNSMFVLWRFAANFYASRLSLLALSAVLGLAATSALAAAMKHTQGSATGSFTITPGKDNAAPVAIHFSGTGTATHIGRIEFTLDTLATFDSKGN